MVLFISSGQKWIASNVTFQLTPTWYYFEAYRLLSPSQRLLHPSQRNHYRKRSLEHRFQITYTNLLPFPEVNNSSRDFAIDTNLILLWRLPSSQSISTAFTPIWTHIFQHDVPGNFFDSNCVEMGVEAFEMDWEDGKLQNNIKLMSIGKSLEKLFTSEQRI